MKRRAFTMAMMGAVVGTAAAGSAGAAAASGASTGSGAVTQPASAARPAGQQAAAPATAAAAATSIGVFIFDRMDQIDFTGPFAVLSRIPDSTLNVFSLDGRAVRDHKGLVLTPDMALADAPVFDVLHIPGGPGQEALMDHEPLLALIRKQADSPRILFSVCTGALLCGAAGALKGKKATTHWSAFDLLPYFGATAVRSRVVVDRNLISAAGVTAGIDGALQLAALLRGDDAAQRIQLDIQYAPEPPFNAGNPETAPAEVLAAVKEKYQPLMQARAQTARRVAQRLGT